ncbi:hypothetical protein BEL07_21000 [Mycolicibacterium grossiae]|uniref:PASTA domain-containing protein n=2 Tax=Mycolicibacterium grossiae TaxID=1552759 RepID=A0A1E8Q1H7_9MYCO|nr:hypothetical protein BEL07_21000 [Mycolicibacterium grossiae]
MVIALTCGPTAVAAPTGSSAADTIARLQAEGNRVVVNKVGTGSLSECSVSSVRPVQVREQPSGGLRPALPFAPTVTVVHVGVQC